MTAVKRQRFHCQPLEEFDRQLRFAPPAKREAQLRRAEILHDEIDPEINYPFDYIAYRITRYRRDRGDATLLVGAAVLPDLRQIIDTLSKSVAIPIADEPTETVSQLAERLGVSTKTINRWRKAGLRWRWVVVPEGNKRQQIGLTRRAVEQFIAADPDRVAKARTFGQMTESQRSKLIDRARQLAANGQPSLNQVADRLSRETGRALETIRLLLHKHDAAHPDAAIFVNHIGPLTDRQKRLIARAHRVGVSMDKLCARFGRTRSTIYRAVHECRAADARAMKLSWVGSPTFTRDDADQVFLRVSEPLADSDDPPRMLSVGVEDLPASLQPFYRRPLLGADRQRSLFLRYNYLKFRAAQLREQFDRYDVRAGDLDQFDRWIAQAWQVRSTLVLAALPTVLSVARRHLVGKSHNSSHRLLGLLQTGLDELLRAVEQYDAARSQRFDAVLTNRLLRRFARESADDEPHRAHRRLTGDSALHHMERLARQHHVDLRVDAGSTTIWPPQENVSPPGDGV